MRRNLNFEDIIRDPDKAGRLNPAKLSALLDDASRILRRESSLVETDLGRILIVGDTHGDFESTKRIVERFLEKNYEKIIFLGDYVDRGYEQVGNINYLLALKVTYPNKFILLRGNHETPLANRFYGFIHQVYERLPPEFYNQYSKIFSELPYASSIGGEILALHGGIPNTIPDLSEISKIRKGLINIDLKNPVELQILWNDPKENISGFIPSIRGSGVYFFGEDVFDQFIEKNNLNFLIRAHEVFRDGYKFFFKKRLLSIFSARNYTFPIKAKMVEVTAEGKIKLLSI